MHRTNPKATRHGPLVNTALLALLATIAVIAALMVSADFAANNANNTVQTSNDQNGIPEVQGDVVLLGLDSSSANNSLNNISIQVGALVNSANVDVQGDAVAPINHLFATIITANASTTPNEIATINAAAIQNIVANANITASIEVANPSSATLTASGGSTALFLPNSALVNNTAIPSAPMMDSSITLTINDATISARLANANQINTEATAHSSLAINTEGLGDAILPMPASISSSPPSSSAIANQNTAANNSPPTLNNGGGFGPVLAQNGSQADVTNNQGRSFEGGGCFGAELVMTTIAGVSVMTG